MVVHDENHGQVARVGHRVACIAEAHLILLHLLASAATHSRLCRASYRLIDRNLVQVARLDIRRLRLLMVWHLDKPGRPPTFIHQIRRHDRPVIIVSTHYTRRVRHDALGLRNRLQCDPRGLRLAIHSIILRVCKVVVREASHVLRLIERHTLIVLIGVGDIEGAEILSKIDLLQRVIT